MDEQRYFLLDRTKGTPVGNPYSMTRELDKDSGGENRAEAESHHSFFTDFQKQPLTFVCPGLKVADFDMYPAGVGEFFLSDRFLEVSKGFNLAESKSIDVLLVSKKRVNIARCGYQILRLPNEEDVVDAKHSVIETSEKFSFLKVTKHLVLDAAKVGGLDLFRIESMSFGSYLFCSQSFKDAAVSAKLNLVFTPVEDVARRYADRIAGA